jgi:hypothetical protein
MSRSHSIEHHLDVINLPDEYAVKAKCPKGPQVTQHRRAIMKWLPASANGGQFCITTPHFRAVAAARLRRVPTGRGDADRGSYVARCGDATASSP